MKYCCSHFVRLINNIGGKGVSAIHVKDYGERRFFLQFRPFDKDVYAFHSQIDSNTGKTKWPNFRNEEGQSRGMNIILNQPIRFCPACGAELKLVIDADFDAFDRLIVDPDTWDISSPSGE